MRPNEHISYPQLWESLLTGKLLSIALSREGWTGAATLCETWGSLQQCREKTWPHCSTTQIIHSWIKWALMSASPWRLSEFSTLRGGACFPRQGCENSSVLVKEIKPSGGGSWDHTATPHRRRHWELQCFQAYSCTQDGGMSLRK